jgi:hypothetical protein
MKDRGDGPQIKDFEISEFYVIKNQKVLKIHPEFQR